MSVLFSPFSLGGMDLSHRVVLAPLTRLRSEDGDVPGQLMVEHYAQRASVGGFLIGEAPAVSRVGRAYRGAPGIWSDEQTAGWKKVAHAVQAKGARMFVQLWHAGRQSHVDMTGGTAPIAPSEVPFEGVAMTADGWVPVSPHRALRTEEIADLIEQFRRGAQNAQAAGFDGVELHAANGYLIDQFLQDGTNQRSDRYGGPVENRARLLLEIVAALASVWGGSRVGVRLSPSGQWGGVSDSNSESTFRYVAGQLNRFGLAYLHIIEPRIKGDDTLHPDQQPVASALLRNVFHGPIIAAGGFDGAGAETILKRGDADLVAFGRHFIANPDLPYRLQHGLPLNAYDRSTFWGGDHHGYTDYPFHQRIA